MQDCIIFLVGSLLIMFGMVAAVTDLPSRIETYITNKREGRRRRNIDFLRKLES
jgi:hypothetical protein